MDPTVQQYLKEHNIEYILHEHKAVFTCEEAAIHCKDVPGLPCKNLFLKDKKTNTFYLVVMPAKKRLQIKDLGKKLELKHLTFGKPEEMQAILKLDPGSVSPLGLINDKEHKTTIIMDKDVWDAEIVSFHPNINTATLELKKEEFHKLIESFGNKKRLMDLT